MSWSSRAPRRRRWPLVLAGIVVLVVGLVIASAVYADSHDPTGTAPSAAPTAPDAAPAAGLTWPPNDVRWFSLQGTMVPLSLAHGPSTNDGVVASGFTHDPNGAVIAAVNVLTRSSGLAGDETVFGPAIARQTTGDVSGYLASIRGVRAALEQRGGAPATVVVGYRLVEVGVDDVRMDVLSRATNPARPSQHALITGTARVRWLDGDWRLVVPTGAGRQVDQVPPGFAPMPGQQLTSAG
ncbi:hypothetical protein ACFORH_38925 [Amycolatopsis roodepoortensis]|uniref:DUF8175 domain-containing protein n=1 Tax=Amycolatopsis roodepoortensis TaxID=700274 RepID=A0ABR9LIK1_9PSEU|nr:hypothetical protein [Amycolatopsis roodepoortensis]MBE1580488.1 hypothetical protein [Amycolatopsis roodepoortensis]